MSEAPHAVIVAMARTPFGKFSGQLSSLSAAQLGSMTMNAVLDRAGLPADTIDAVYAGVGMIGAATLTPVRQAVLMSRLPQTTPSLAVDRACCSGMTAIGLAYKDIAIGCSKAVLAGGFESLSQTPLLWPRQQKQKLGTVTVDDPLLLRAPVVDRQIAVYTGEESLRNGVTREMQDAWALGSHARYAAAQAGGYFDVERIPVDVAGPKGTTLRIERDESPRTDTTIEKLASLAPIYGGATVTAGNAPGLNDGGAFVLVLDSRVARELGLKPLARILGYAQVADGPTSGTSTPAIAINAVLKQQGLTPAQLDLLEINEAYAATPLVSTLKLAGGDLAQAEVLRARTNVHGGAVAIGHPLGASGARIVMTLVAGLMKRGGGRGVAAICGGFGQGDGLLVEVTG